MNSLVEIISSSTFHWSFSRITLSISSKGIPDLRSQTTAFSRFVMHMAILPPRYGSQSVTHMCSPTEIFLHPAYRYQIPRSIIAILALLNCPWIRIYSRRTIPTRAWRIVFSPHYPIPLPLSLRCTQGPISRRLSPALMVMRILPFLPKTIARRLVATAVGQRTHHNSTFRRMANPNLSQR